MTVDNHLGKEASLDKVFRWMIRGGLLCVILSGTLLVWYFLLTAETVDIKNILVGFMITGFILFVSGVFGELFFEDF